MKTTGFALLVVGLLLTLFTTFKYFTKEKVVDIGKVEITADKGHNVSWSPIIGIGIMIIGGIVLYSDSRK
ncbi:MAG TPA: hypothetical protein DCL77_16350 [Prolixibacteraceae bacterium]|jgi:hypothetical protein|nr:hypothetical protein [Prolixibacteraceae bacterium]